MSQDDTEYYGDFFESQEEYEDAVAEAMREDLDIE